MPQDIARLWFVPGEGIDRHVISADIQRYLGNDATVRPGVGTGEDEGVQGYWIKAYRNLTSPMVQDLRNDSARWRAEQRQTGTREPYVGSSTYAASSAARTVQARRDGDSPSLEGPYGLPPNPRDRIPVDNRMQIDPQPMGRGAGYPPDNRGGGGQYPADNRGFPSDNRGYAPDVGRSQYRQDTAMSGFDNRPPPPPQVSAPYGQDPRYNSNYPPPGNDGAPPGYVRQGNYYVPVTSYESPQSMPARSDNYGPDAFGGQPQGSRNPRDPRDSRDMRDPRDPRYQQPPPPPQEYQQDPRYAYPSPAATVSGISRDREQITSPQQPSYASGPMPPQQYNQYASGGMPPPSGSVNRPPGNNQNRQSASSEYPPRPGGTPTSSNRNVRR